ncbi:transporter substrate-binding domain-containing protein [Aquincola sp. MAHUQ-54]|uniref:Transporter substrate-binding domain-containing protein n=1 Tax=Aquincola agrisoli TaxID=3119538 RepID=A0AAW9QIH9_9BURK
MTSLARRTTLGLAAAVLLWGGAAQAQNTLDHITRTKKVRIAIPTDYPPYGFVGVDLKPQGLDIDMARYIAAKLGATPELVPVTSANRIPYLQTKKVDIVISTLGKTPEREQVVDFTHAYSPFFQAVFAAKSVSIKSWADLSGKTVSVTRGAMADTELGKVIPAGVDVKRFEDHVGTVSAFVSGQVQVIATSAAEGATIMKQNPKLDTEYKLLLKESPNYMGVGKGETALKDRLNALILEARRNGEIDKLSTRWLGRGAGDLPM